MTEISDIVADSDRTENNLETIAGSLEGVVNAVSSDIPISEEVTICSSVGVILPSYMSCRLLLCYFAHGPSLHNILELHTYVNAYMDVRKSGLPETQLYRVLGN